MLEEMRLIPFIRESSEAIRVFHPFLPTMGILALR
jgi:hypothetical protein